MTLHLDGVHLSFLSWPVERKIVPHIKRICMLLGSGVFVYICVYIIFFAPLFIHNRMDEPDLSRELEIKGQDTYRKSDILPSLQNVVSTFNLDCKLDLKKIALRARNAEYNPKRFAAVVMRIRNPKTTALIFSSGKVVITGAKCEHTSKFSAQKFSRILYKLGFNTKFFEFKIQNMVSSCDIQFSIRLEGLALAHSNFCSYEPELFPGLIYRMVKPKVVLLIFVSGKIVLTGAKMRDEVYEAFDNIYPVLTQHKKI